jgi:hypothetical protein
VRDADVGQQRVDVIVAAEKRVEAGFEPVAVAIAPCGELTAGNIPLL